MVIILEGHDLCGKSTTAARWGTEYGIPVVKPWADLSFSQASLTSISRTLLSLARTSEHMILDRFITSEYVYGPMFGREVSYLDDLLSEWRDGVGGLCVIQCTISEDELSARYETRGDSNLSLEQVFRVRQLYSKLPMLLPEWVELIPCTSFGAFGPELARRYSALRR